MKQPLKVVEVKPLMMLPPAPGCCQVCATKHDPKDPHNAHSIYYQMAFNMKNKRGPTWKDAMEHCDTDTKVRWAQGLLEAGIDIERGDLYPPKGD